MLSFMTAKASRRDQASCSWRSVALRCRMGGCAVLAAVLAGGMPTAGAETSSWSTRTHESRAPEATNRSSVPASQRRPRTRQRKPKVRKSTRSKLARPTAETRGALVPITTTPQSIRARRLLRKQRAPRSGRTTRKAAHKAAHKAAPAGGDMAAYYAFDRAQFLTALTLAKKAAARGQPEAHTLIGRIYGEGHGVPRDLKTAAKWYHRAAQLGDPEGAFALGLMYAEGRGVKKNYDYAASLFERAAIKRHIYANYNLGMLFLAGLGKPENPLRGALHVAYAAKNGIAAAQYDLATLYASGHGVPHDTYLASLWLRRAAELGSAEAKLEYAVMLLRGRGLNADRPRAVAMLRAAAKRGLAGAQNRLAHVYANGVGTKRDRAEAAKWRLVAQAQGVTDDKLDRLVASLPAAQRRKAEQWANQWLEQARASGRLN